MHIFFWLVLLDWLVVLLWLWRVTVWRLNLRRVPDLTTTVFAHPAGPLPTLSVIVPARNEEAAIAATLDSLLASEGVALQIIAVDDRSSDRTSVIMDGVARSAFGRAHVTLEVLHIANLPAGWLGKTHAMALAAQQATGEWLLFTDGDILFHPDALRRALSFAVGTGGDHMVLAPTVLLQTAGERMMIAFLHVLSLFAVRLWRVPDPASRRDAIGVGAFNMLRRDVYDALGGWGAFRLEVVEDIALGRRVKAMGFAQRVALGVDLVRVRWAVGALGVVANLTKNLFAFAGFRVEVLLAGAGALAMFTLFPLAMCFAGRAAWWPMAILLIALFLAYQRAGRYHNFTATQMLLYPAASCLLIFALLRSMILALWRGGIYWRGTFYALAELRRNRVLGA